MEAFEITSSVLNNQYNFRDDNLVVNGNYTKDAETNELQSISGTCYRALPEGGMGDFVGNFNGYMRNGEMKYSTSEMTRQDSDKVWTAIGEIEQYIIGPNQENKEMSQ